MEQLEWMHIVDTRILDYLRERNTDCTPEEIADALYYLPDYIDDRCQILAAQGLVQPLGHTDTSYEIRDLGVEFFESNQRTKLLEGRSCR